MGSPSGQPPSRAAAHLGAAYGRYLRAVCARPGSAALVLGVLCLPALVLSVGFFGHIDPGLQELLPPSTPSVRALNTLHRLVGGKAHLAVIARSPEIGPPEKAGR